MTRLLNRLRREERGTTLVELVVGISAGLMVIGGVTTLAMLTINTSSRVSARVHATQDSRLSLTQLIDQLHSACIAPKVPPIRVGSSGSELRFVHANGAEVSPTPVLTKITFSNGSLIQRDYSWDSGTAPFWTFNETAPIRTKVLNERIAPLPGKQVFTYYAYASGALSPTAQAVPLSEYDASRTIYVTIAFMAKPRRDNGEDDTPARIQGSASLRLTAASYNPAAPSLPCQ